MHVNSVIPYAILFATTTEISRLPAYGTRVSYTDPENRYNAPVVPEVPKSDVRLRGFGGNTIENTILRWEESADLDRRYAGVGLRDVPQVPNSTKKHEARR